MRVAATFVLLLALNQEVNAVRNLRIASPLQALTIWDDKTLQKDRIAATPRGQFLAKFRAGLEAEARVSKELAEKDRLPVDAKSPNWAKEASVAESKSRDTEERLLEEAFDRAVLSVKVPIRVPDRYPGRYQFVGVIGSSHRKDSKPITWYARKKPANSRWTVRLVHVNRDAILKDLFDSGKIDIFGRYDNTGKVNPETQLPVIQSKYSVRERSWKNLWNFSPKHLFTDSSGMYWRERRLRPGLYTDGKTVYEASYRYRDGRNGMHRRSTFQQFMDSKSVDSKMKQRLLGRLKKDTPDVVLEE